MRCLSRLWLIVLALVLPTAISVAEDVQLREKAVTLLERANSLGIPHEFAAYDQVITFQSFTSTGTQRGQFTSVVQGPRSYRDEYQFGDFDLLVVVNGSLIADVGDRARAPVEVRRMTRLNRPYSARFDQSDIIRSIQESEVNGRPAHCIEFDTVVGEKSDANELCIDAQLGVVLRAHANNETVTNSDYFAYRDTYLPAHITYEQTGLRMELQQVKKEIEGSVNSRLSITPAECAGRECLHHLSPALWSGDDAAKTGERVRESRCDASRHGPYRWRNSLDKRRPFRPSGLE